MVGKKRSTEEELTEDRQSRLFGFRAAYVFDVSQTDGEPLPEFASVTGDPGDLIDKIKHFVAEKSVMLEYSETIRPAHGVSSGGKITLLPDLTAPKSFRFSFTKLRMNCFIAATGVLQPRTPSARPKQRLWPSW